MKMNCHHCSQPQLLFLKMPGLSESFLTPTCLLPFFSLITVNFLQKSNNNVLFWVKKTLSPYKHVSTEHNRLHLISDNRSRLLSMATYTWFSCQTKYFAFHLNDCCQKCVFLSQKTEREDSSPQAVKKTFHSFHFSLFIYSLCQGVNQSYTHFIAKRFIYAPVALRGISTVAHRRMPDGCGLFTYDCALWLLKAIWSRLLLVLGWEGGLTAERGKVGWGESRSSGQAASLLARVAGNMKTPLCSPSVRVAAHQRPELRVVISRQSGAFSRQC